MVSYWEGSDRCLIILVGCNHMKIPCGCVKSVNIGCTIKENNELIFFIGKRY